MMQNVIHKKRNKQGSTPGNKNREKLKKDRTDFFYLSMKLIEFPSFHPFNSKAVNQALVNQISCRSHVKGTVWKMLIFQTT